MNVLISVIIPTHQRPQLLKNLLESLDLQTLEKEKFEIIVVPTPLDPGVLITEVFKKTSKLQLQCKLPENDPWQGRNVSFKRNFGAEEAKASWLAFIDDDCIATPDWLMSAIHHFTDPLVAGVEGKTITPTDSPRTLTWKGMQRLSQFGGYQTCNIFYHRQSFLDVGGFDSVSFPWYLEDSDLAWSILDTGKKIISEIRCVVIHPVGPPAPWRLIHEAQRMGLKVLLYKKHPQIYTEKKTKCLRLYHYVYLTFWLALIISVLTLDIRIIIGVILSFFGTITLHMIRTFSGLKTTALEVLKVGWGVTVSPPIAFLSVLSSLFKQRCTLRESLYLLVPHRKRSGQTRL